MNGSPPGQVANESVSVPPICAVVVTYFPDPGFAQRLRRIATECARIVIVDNGSVPGELAPLASEQKEIVTLPRNLGLATALNRGLARAIELGFQWAITFDQDSMPSSGMAAALWATRERSTEPARVAVVGPRLREEKVAHEERRWVVPHPRWRWLFQRVICRDSDLAGVAFVITSGALMDLGIFRRIGPLLDELFIDYIDHEYCLRARRAGCDIMVSAGALLTHNLGAKREFRLGPRTVRPTFHPAERLRYMFRNRWVLLRRHGRHFPHWVLFDFIFVHFNLLRVVLYEDQRREKLMAAVRGTWDGLLGRTGEIGP